MAATKQRGNASSASRSGSGTNGGRAKSSSSSPKRSSSSAPKTRARTQSNGRTAASRSKPKSAQARRSPSRTSASSSNGNVAQKATDAVKTSVVPMASAAVAAAAGIAGGVVLGRTALARKRKILGVKVPGTGNGLDNLAKNVGEAGKQFGRFAREVRTAREKAEEIGKALT